MWDSSCFLFGLFLLAVALPELAQAGGNGFECYVCNSEENELCNDPQDDATVAQLPKRSNCHTCYKVKTVTKIFGTAGREEETRMFTSRFCLHEKDVSSNWWTDSGSGSYAVGAYCSSKHCNGADVSTASLATCLTMSIMGFVVTAIM